MPMRLTWLRIGTEPDGTDDVLTFAFEPESELEAGR
jgi:hypothetical protein